MTDAQPAERHPSFFYPGEPVADDEMRITALGTSMPFVRRRQASAGWLVELGNGDVFIVDLGTASTTNLNALGVPHAKLDRVFLTHLHVDHWGDLTSLYASVWRAIGSRRSTSGARGGRSPRETAFRE